MMKKLTAERCKRQIEEWQRMMSVSDVAVMVELNLQAYLIALPVLEQQEKQAEQQVDSDGWIEWKGGECPISLPRQEVEYLTRIGNKHITPAGDLRWYHEDKGGDIIAYRVVEQERERGEEA